VSPESYQVVTTTLAFDVVVRVIGQATVMHAEMSTGTRYLLSPTQMILMMIAGVETQLLARKELLKATNVIDVAFLVIMRMSATQEMLSLVQLCEMGEVTAAVMAEVAETAAIAVVEKGIMPTSAMQPHR
jgi:hypothetical protein